MRHCFVCLCVCVCLSMSMCIQTCGVLFKLKMRHIFMHVHCACILVLLRKHLVQKIIFPLHFVFVFFCWESLERKTTNIWSSFCLKVGAETEPQWLKELRNSCYTIFTWKPNSFRVDFFQEKYSIPKKGLCIHMNHTLNAKRVHYYYCGNSHIARGNSFFLKKKNANLQLVLVIDRTIEKD